MALRERAFEAACGLFYEALGSPDLLPAALQLIGEACGARGASIMPFGLGPGLTVGASSLAEYVSAMVGEGWEFNERAQRALHRERLGKRGLITDRELYAPDELKRDRMYNEFLAPRGMGPFAGMVLARFGTTVKLPIGIVRTAKEGPFVPSEIATMNRYMAYLKPAADLALHMGLAQSKRFSDVLDEAGASFVLLSAQGKILHNSPSFEQFIGDAFQIRHGRVVSWHPPTNDRLGAAIGKATSRESILNRIVSEVRLLRRSGKRPLKVQLIPVVRSAHDVFMLARVAMRVTDPEPVRPSQETVDQALEVYGLTKAEKRLAGRIAEGETLAAAAYAESVAPETARSRLKVIFQKTDTHRQTELALLVATLLH